MSFTHKMQKWLFQDKHKKAAHDFKNRTEHAFTDHPHEAGETYLQHLWFTLRMAGRFAFLSFAVAVHGIFPFLFTTTASTEMEKIYHIMKSRSSPAHKHEKGDKEQGDAPITIGEIYDGQ